MAERRIKPGATGLAAHGLTDDEVERVTGEMAAAGFTGVQTQSVRAGRRVMTIIQAFSREQAP